MNKKILLLIAILSTHSVFGTETCTPDYSTQKLENGKTPNELTPTAPSKELSNLKKTTLFLIGFALGWTLVSKLLRAYAKANSWIYYRDFGPVAFGCSITYYKN
ncbi:MAG: hypothetical protein H6679_00345 [Epsilonproteobacteria bacterium]|nr:hypothetical protein [Campylobacterota bacterium]